MSALKALQKTWILRDRSIEKAWKTRASEEEHAGIIATIILISDGRTSLHVFVECFQESICTIALPILHQNVSEESFSAGMREARTIIVRNKL